MIDFFNRIESMQVFSVVYICIPVGDTIIKLGRLGFHQQGYTATLLVCLKPVPGFPSTNKVFLCSVFSGEERWLFVLLIFMELLTITD